MASLVLYWADYRMDLLSVTFSHMKQALETAKSTAITLYQEASKLHTEHRPCDDQRVCSAYSWACSIGVPSLED